MILGLINVCPKLQCKGRFIYIDVLLALKKKEDKGILVMDEYESSNIENCIFYVNPYYEQNRSKKAEELQQTFSLFCEVF